MRPALFVVPLLLSGHAAPAQPASVDVAEIARDARPFVGRPIRLAGIRCANEPDGLFACGAERDATTVRVESLALDFRTSAATRRKLLASCRMPLRSAPEACIFTVEVKPLNVNVRRSDGRSSKTVVYLKARRMDLF